MNTKLVWIARVLTAWLPESSAFGFKRYLYRFAGAQIGQNVRIYSSAMIQGVGKLRIGDNVHIGSQVVIMTNSGAIVDIGSDVDIGPGVMLLTGSHKINPKGSHIAGEGISESISIGSGCWLGARTTVLPGVVLPQKTITAAGSVVVVSPKQSERPILLTGVPAIVKKELS